MSVIKVNNITNLDGTSGPVIAGITTVSSTSHFVVPTGSTGQRVALAQDPFINNLVLALPFNSESVFSDLSPKNNSPAPAGIGTTTASLPFGVSGVTATSSGIVTFSKYYGTSAYFDGDGDYLKISGSSDLSFSTGDFTVESWVYQTADNTYPTLFEIGNHLSSSGIVFITRTSGNAKIYSGGFVGAASFSLGQWNHLAFVRSSGNLLVFVNGVLGSTTTFTNNLSDSSSAASGWSVAVPNANYYFNGYLQDLRIYKGVAKYTSNFTPPTQIAL